MPEFYYRYYDANWDSYCFEISCERFRVVKKTPKGAWIEELYRYKPKKRFVLDGARRRYAYPTKELALNSYKIRKEWQIQHCKNMIDRAQTALDVITNSDAQNVAGVWNVYEENPRRKETG